MSDGRICQQHPEAISAGHRAPCGGLGGSPTSSTMSLLNHLVPASMFLLLSVMLIPDLGTGMVVPSMAGTCPPDTQMCLDGSQCYAKALHCDGKEDCEDGTDEFECKNEVTDTCIGEFSCKDGNGCVKLSKVCDKVEDCADGSDESNCTTECEDVNHFRCGNGKCIAIELQCNEIDDCGDLSDEQSCTKIEMNCTEDEFVCPDGTCLSRYRVCDGYPNCHDGSDERGPCDLSTMSTIAEATGSVLTTLTPAAEVADVANVTTKPAVCPEHNFQCLSGECIPHHEVCDGKPDCADETDEQDCSSKKASCSDGFLCTNGECIPKEWMCDNVHDCTDKSDEEHCVEVTETPNRKTREQSSDRVFEMRYEILKQERIQQEHLYQLKVKELDLKIQTANVELDAAKKLRTAAWDKVDQQAEVHRLTVLSLLKNATSPTHEAYDVEFVQQTATTAQQ